MHSDSESFGKVATKPLINAFYIQGDAGMGIHGRVLSLVIGLLFVLCGIGTPENKYINHER